MTDGYTCGYCGAEHEEIEAESCTLTGDILSVQMANIIEFESQYKGEGHIFCDIDCFGEWLAPRVHRLFEDDEANHQAREAAIGASLPANWRAK